MTDEPSVTPSGAGDSVTLEQLRYLLGLEHETQALDYKQSCDLNERRAVVELAKDVAAMQIDGGWIVIGANNSGVPVPPGVPDKDRKLFDEATLRPKLAAYLPLPFELHTAVHTIEGCTLALIRAPAATGRLLRVRQGRHL